MPMLFAYSKLYHICILMTNSSQDELAETQIAEPGYAGTNYEIEMDSFEFDLLGYWDDLEYTDDPYWEYDMRQTSRQAETEHTGQKRKRGVASKAATMDKRRKVTGSRATSGSGVEVEEVRDNVVYISQKERCRAKILPILEERKPVAFLADWRQRYANQEGLVVVEMPTDMRQASQAKDSGTPPNPCFVNAMAEDVQEEGDWDIDGDGGMANLATNFDSETLKTVLHQRLEAAGLHGVDEGAFITTLNRMLAGDEDEAAGELADTILGHVTSEDGRGNAISGWLSQQGVSLNQAAEEDASSVCTADLPDESMLQNNCKRKSEISLTDSGISVGGSSQTNSKLMATRNGPNASQKKRSIDGGTEWGGANGKKVTFDVPPSSEPGPQPGPVAPEVPTSEDPLLSEPTVSTSATRTTRSKASRIIAEKADGIGTGSKVAMFDEEVEASLVGGVEQVVMESAKQTRKRKAPPHEADDLGRQENLTKKSTMRRTRSARAKVRK